MKGSLRPRRELERGPAKVSFFWFPPQRVNIDRTPPRDCVETRPVVLRGRTPGVCRGKELISLKRRVRSVSISLPARFRNFKSPTRFFSLSSSLPASHHLKASRAPPTRSHTTRDERSATTGAVEPSLSKGQPRTCGSADAGWQLPTVSFISKSESL